MKDLKNLEIADYINVIWRRRWYFIITTVSIIATASYIISRLPDVYKSEARIQVESPFVSEDYVRPIVQSNPIDRIASIRAQVSSRTFLERIVEQFQYGGYGTPSGLPMDQAVMVLRNQIGIESTSNNVFLLTFTTTDPQLARDVNQRLADELIRSSTASRVDKTMATSQFMDEQLRDEAAALSQQEEKIRQFKTAHLHEMPDSASANVNAITGLYSRLSATENALEQAQDQQKMLDYKRQERKRLEMLAQSVANTGGAPRTNDKKEPLSIGPEAELASKKAALTAMLRKYTQSHPDVLALSREIKELEQQIEEWKEAAAALPKLETPVSKERPEAGQMSTAQPDEDPFRVEAESIDKQIRKREKEKQDILYTIKTYEARFNLAPALEEELSRLLRDYDILRQQYLNLQNKKFNSQMAATVETDKKNETYKIIDPPSHPTKPVYPNRLQYVLMAIAGGFVSGIITAFGRELMDTTISNENEAIAVLNLPVLASISELPKRRQRRAIASFGA
jgi:polysaccharide chain length determinant protein (PEP-CTERM system associated)